MNGLKLLYGAVFLLISTALLLLTGLGSEIRLAMEASAGRKQKKQSFQKQGRLKRKLCSTLTAQKTLVKEGAFPVPFFLLLAALCAAGGFLAGKVVFNSAFLSCIIGALATLIPLLLLNFRRQKSRSKAVNRLESSMMAISNSYLVTEDLLTSVKENLPILEYPEPFRDFLTYATMMDSNMTSALRRMENRVNNPYFSQWVDVLVMAQSDRNLRYVTIPVVDAMHNVLKAQEESDAAMYAVWREYFLTLALIFCVPLVFKLLMHDAYLTMTASLAGQSMMVLLLAAIVFSVFKALQINKPVML